MVIMCHKMSFSCHFMSSLIVVTLLLQILLIEAIMCTVCYMLFFFFVAKFIVVHVLAFVTSVSV